jgi:circadian clock protein KaiC
MSSARTVERSGPGLPKCPTGITGLDEITGGGLPRGRTTLVCGGAGSGKTLLGMEFLVRGATDFGEPGVFVAFEETRDELTQNVASLGFDLTRLAERQLIHVDHVRVDRSEIEATGDYDLEGLFIRLGHAIDTIKAKRVVLDTIETLFGGLSNAAILRSELRRLFRWLNDRGVTTVITGERGGGPSLTRHGLEEYVSDCVIVLDHRVNEQVSTRRLRVVKYRGSTHGANEYPFLIDQGGISVLPITSLGLEHAVSDERISSGVPRLDAMLGGKGYFRGSSVLVSGTAGTGKTSLAASFADATCRRGERCLYLSFEESQGQMVRNMRSIGLDLEPWIAQGLLRFHAARPTLSGLEMHLLAIHKLVQEVQPSAVVIDPISAFVGSGDQSDAGSMVLRLADFLKGRQITAFLTNLVTGNQAQEATELSISSLIDTWLLVRDIELGGERNRGLYVLKSRGMSHSNQIREFLLTDHGVELVNAYVGAGGVLVGSMRLTQESQERAAAKAREDEIGRRQRTIERKRLAVEAQVAALRVELESDEEELQAALSEDESRATTLSAAETAMGLSRKSDLVESANGSPLSHVLRGAL